MSFKGQLARNGIDITGNTIDFPDKPLSVGSLPAIRFPGDGECFYLDPSSGSDSNSGLTPAQAVATLSGAYDLCTDGRGDMIIRMPGTEVMTATLTWSKSKIAVIALSQIFGNPYFPEYFLTYSSGLTTETLIDVSGGGNSFIGLDFSGYASSGPVITFEGEGGGFYGGANRVENCRFVRWNAETSGILFNAGAYNIVKDCVFEGAYSNAGIYFDSTASNNPTNNKIVHCYFEDIVGGYGIGDDGANGHNLIIEDCVFGPDITAGHALNLSGSDGIMVNCSFDRDNNTEIGTFTNIAEINCHYY